jgi:hypothetical protein
LVIPEQHYMQIQDQGDSNDLAQSVEHNQDFIMGYVINIPLAIVSAMSLYGIYKNKPNWLWPFIILLVNLK